MLNIRKTLNLVAMLTALNFAHSAAADPGLTPDDIRNMYPEFSRGPCIEKNTGQTGYCHLFAVGDGTVYMVFVQNRQPVFMRRTLITGGYTEVWRNVEQDDTET